MSNRQQGKSQETAAAKAAISQRSGRRIEKDPRAKQEERHWRTHEDPLEAIWEKELLPLLERESQVTGLTLWEYLEDEHPAEFPYSVLRTLQRRVKHWKATQGPDKVVIFRQSVPAGHKAYRTSATRIRQLPSTVQSLPIFCISSVLPTVAGVMYRLSWVGRAIQPWLMACNPRY